MRRLLLALVLIATGSPAFAQEQPKANNAEGEYSGVEPGKPKKVEPGKKAKKPPPKGTLSWIGFEAKDGSTELFMQSVAPFEVSQKIENGVLVISLTGVSRLAANVWRFLDTRYFETPVSRITAKKKGKGVEVRITFKNAKDAAQGSMRTSTEADGLYYAYLSFAGTGTPVDTTPPKKK